MNLSDIKSGNRSGNSAYTTHDTALMLLPWYINGSLDREQQLMVDEHLAVCLTCRSELNSQHRIAHLVQSRDASSIGADTGFAQMCKRIQPVQRTRLHQRHQQRTLFAGISARMWVSAAAVAASIFITLPLLHELDEPLTRPGEFRTLSEVDGHFDIRENSLRVMFSTGLDDNIRQDILRMIDAAVITVSTYSDVLTVQVPEGELIPALTLLRDRPEVRLAEPVYTGIETSGSE